MKLLTIQIIMATILATGILSTLSVTQPVIADDNDQGDDFIWENVDNPSANSDDQGNDIASNGIGDDDGAGSVAGSGGGSQDDIAGAAEDDQGEDGVGIIPDIDENTGDEDGAGSVAGP